MRYLDRRMGAAEALHNLIMHEAQYLVIIVMDYRLSVIKFSLSQWAWNAALTPWLWLSTPRSPSLAVCTASQLVKIYFFLNIFSDPEYFSGKDCETRGNARTETQLTLDFDDASQARWDRRRNIPSRSFLYQIFFSYPWSWWQLEWLMIND